jgi:two-component system response regulator GlrR
VEDHADSREATRRLLLRAGCTVLTADSYRAAVTMASTVEIDVLVSDLQLPDGDGRALLPALRAIRPLAGILVTGSTLAPDEAQRSLQAGFCHHLTKPLIFDDLMKAILRCAAPE